MENYSNQKAKISTKKKCNANRLAFAIYNNADDFTIKQLARLLNYEVDQLKNDIIDLLSYISDLEYILDED